MTSLMYRRAPLVRHVIAGFVPRTALTWHEGNHIAPKMRGQPSGMMAALEVETGARGGWLDVGG